MSRNILDDPKLPHLRTVIDTTSMCRLFEDHFREAYPEHGFRVVGSSIEKIYYRLHKHCGVLHRLRLLDARGRESRHWFFVRHFPIADGPRRFEKAQRKASAPASFWAPVTFWRDLGMVILANGTYLPGDEILDLVASLDW